MTRLPSPVRDVRGIVGPAYELNPVCAAPACSNPSADPHHLWRRSELAGAYDWVEIDGVVLRGNVVGLCRPCHDAVTVNAAWITLDDGVFYWSGLLSPPRPLSFQPPTHPEIAVPKPPEKNEAEPHSGPFADGSCPTCLRPLPVKREVGETKRTRRTWSITVPKDEREDGADTLDTLLDAAREEMAKAGLPYGEEDSVKFFVLTAALGLFVQHAEEVLG